MAGDVSFLWDHMRSILLLTLFLFICQAAQYRFDDALARADLVDLIAILTQDGASVDPSTQDQFALRLACDRGCLPLLDLLLQHPLACPRIEHLGIAISKNSCDVTERLITDGRVDLGSLYNDRLSAQLKYLLSNIPLRLLQACTEPNPEYIHRFNPSKLRLSQLDMLVARAAKHEKTKEALYLLQLTRVSIPRRDAKLFKLMSRHPEWKTFELTFLIKPWIAAQLGLHGALHEEVVDRIAEFCIPDPMTWRYSLRPHIELALSLYSLVICFQFLDMVDCKTWAYIFLASSLAQIIRLGFKRHRIQLGLSQIPGRLLILNGMAVVLFIGVLPFVGARDTEYKINQLAYFMALLYVYITMNRT